MNIRTQEEANRVAMSAGTAHWPLFEWEISSQGDCAKAKLKAIDGCEFSIEIECRISGEESGGCTACLMAQREWSCTETVLLGATAADPDRACRSLKHKIEGFFLSLRGAS